MRKRLEAFSRRRGFGWLRVALAVQQRYGELNGNYLASAVTLSAFMSLFPLLLVAGSIVGFIASGKPDIGNQVIENLGLTGAAADTVRQMIATAESSRQAASIIGLGGLLWTGLGLVSAMQYAVNVPWQIKGRGVKDKLSALLWLAGFGPLFLATFGLGAALNYIPGFLSPLGVLLGLGLNTAMWLWTMKVMLHRKVGWRALLPGAILGAVGLELLKLVGAIYVPRLVASASALYGSLGVVFAILAWLLFFGRLLVYANTLNVVRWEEEHGTVTVEIEVPKAPPLDDEATRAGETDPDSGPDEDEVDDYDPAIHTGKDGRPEIRAS
ncbi:MAG: rane protein [Actinomycetota bacterium]|jgi:membrane protein|nr:rane protein [Actinomycetota bacterium]